MIKQSGMRCYISGKVQGVWFRATAKQQAERLAITGWARNLVDGRVEVVAYGEKDQLDLFYSWLQQGPEHAQVTECTREEFEWIECLGFSIF